MERYSEMKKANETVRNAYEDLVRTSPGTDITNCPTKSYTSNAIQYMQNQEVYLNQFLEDGNIASNNSKCERKFAFLQSCGIKSKCLAHWQEPGVPPD